MQIIKSVLPVGCRGRSCCTSSVWHRSSGGSCGMGCSCSCHEYRAIKPKIEKN